ncbi:MAG: polysaccharide biosynthesis tyrosine autokinase [Rhizobacter sp.]
MRIEARQPEEQRFDTTESIWGADADVVVTDRPIGGILTETKRLQVGQIDQVLEYQRRKGVRFGEAAVALKFITEDDVMFALSQQFHYPYAPHTRHDLSGELVAAMQPFSEQAEAFRALRSQLMMRMFMPGAVPRALAVVSPERGDGKTFFAANLAIVMAQLGGRTLLIDANLRGPRLHQMFSIPEGNGLSGVLSGRQQANVIHQVADLSTLFVLPVGVTPPNPLELVERPAFSRLLSELLGKFDHVIVDTPAAQRGSDAGVIAARCGAALVVARRHQSRLGALHQLVSRLKDSPAQLAGMVINEY